MSCESLAKKPDQNEGFWCGEESGLKNVDRTQTEKARFLVLIALNTAAVVRIISLRLLYSTLYLIGLLSLC